MSRKTIKARKKRAEDAAMAKAHQETGLRDGFCRVAGCPFLGPCAGVSEFAHVGDYRRFKTRGKAPEERHTSKGGVRLCSGHHRVGQYAYDAHAFDIEFATDREADGPVRIKVGEYEFIC